MNLFDENEMNLLNQHRGDSESLVAASLLARLATRLIIILAGREIEAAKEKGPLSSEHIAAMELTEQAIKNFPLGPETLAHLFASELATRDLDERHGR